MKQEKNILYFRRLFLEIRDICVSLLFVNGKNQNTEIYENIYCICKFLFDAQMNAYNERKNAFWENVGFLKKMNIGEQDSCSNETSLINLAVKKGYAFSDNADLNGCFSFGELLLEPNFNANIWMNGDLFVNENMNYADNMKYCINLFQEILDFLKNNDTKHLSFDIKEVLMRYYVLIYRYGAFVY